MFVVVWCVMRYDSVSVVHVGPFNICYLYGGRELIYSPLAANGHKDREEVVGSASFVFCGYLLLLLEEWIATVQVPSYRHH